MGAFGPHVVDLEPDGQIFTSADSGATFERVGLHGETKHPTVN